jgi:hypothetical protein
LTLLLLNRRDDAAQQSAAGCAVAAGLPSAYAKAKASLGMYCAMGRARLALADGATAQALTFAQRALALARVERSEDPITDRYKIAITYSVIGDVQKRAGDTAGAEAAWDAGLAELPSNVAERPDEMDARLQLLQRLGRSHDAAPLSARLSMIGYRSVG